MFGVILDSGYCIKQFQRKSAARKFIDRHNRIAREQKERGDMVSLRYAVGIVRRKV